jgi:hypothetical protein
MVRVLTNHYSTEADWCITLFSSFLFPLMEKETKRSRTNEWLRPFVRPTHTNTLQSEDLFVFAVKSRRLCFLICGTLKGAGNFPDNLAMGIPTVKEMHRR